MRIIFFKLSKQLSWKVGLRDESYIFIVGQHSDLRGSMWCGLSLCSVCVCGVFFTVHSRPHWWQTGNEFWVMGLLQGTVCLKQLKQGCWNVTVAPAITSHTQGQCTDLKKKTWQLSAMTSCLYVLCRVEVSGCLLVSRPLWLRTAVLTRRVVTARLPQRVRWQLSSFTQHRPRSRNLLQRYYGMPQKRLYHQPPTFC